MPLIIVGDSPYNRSYLSILQKLTDERVNFVGRINNQSKLNSLYKGAYIYIHGHEVGGTNPSLLLAMDSATAPFVIDVSFNKHVVADCGFVFGRKEGHLSNILVKLIDDPIKVNENWK